MTSSAFCPSPSELIPDLTGNGVKESSLIDLDYPIQELADGRKYVPIYTFLVMDADGLLNLNAHGNLNGIRTAANISSGQGYSHTDVKALSTSTSFVSTSNFGLSSSEINIARALPAHPQDTNYIDLVDLDPALDPYQGMFGYGGTATNRGQMANMETARLLFGSPDYDSAGALTGTDVTPGRWGEEDSLINALAGTVAFPGPGQSDFDDNLNYNDVSISTDDTSESLYFGGGLPRLDPALNNLAIPSYVHPSDFQGLGTAYLSSAGNGMNRARTGAVPSDPNNPSRWMTYSDKWQYQGLLTVNGVTPYTKAGDVTTTFPNFLFEPNPSALWLVDEPAEVKLEPTFRDPIYDRVFDSSEMAGLHLTNSDYTLLNPSSRLRTLLSFNFEKNKQAAVIRSQFTTESWDRMEFGMVRNSFSPRTFEFNDDTVTGKLRFPPKFASAGDAKPYGSLDPFRPEVRQWLTIEQDHTHPIGSSDFLPQRRLDINRILDSNQNGNGTSFRNLTPHPEFTSADTGGTLDTMVHVNIPTVGGGVGHPAASHSVYNFASISTNKLVQEWWARYDRQRMARDIYVLLYTMGSGNDALNTTTTAYPAGTIDSPKEMAQFAVNMVDALDRDSVITKFVYDTDLSDGWNIDVVPGQAEYVQGVESQQLSLSEALWIHSKKNGSSVNHQSTLFDETTQDHQYMYMELRNASPFPIPLGTGTWRIRTETTAATPVAIGTLTFKAGSSTVSVTPGQNFTIGTHDGTTLVQGGANNGKVRSSTFRVDIDVDNDSSYDEKFRAIVPYKSDASMPTGATASEAHPAPLVDFDLAHERDRTADLFEESSTAPGAAGGYLLHKVDGAGDLAETTIRIILERRQNLYALKKLDNDPENTSTTDNDNDWVEVDRMVLNSKIFDLGDTTRAASYLYDNTSGAGKLSDLKSFERKEPLDPSASADFTGANPLFRHTLGGPTITHNNNDPATQPAASTARYNQPNSVAASVNKYWQPHFDRDFTSVYELLSIPLFETSKLRTAGVVSAGGMNGANTAQSRFLVPNNLVNTDVNDDNRWYRILELLEVHNTSHSSIRDQLTMPRLPGKVQLNTLRHPGVLSAVLDDSFHIQDYLLIDPNEPLRHWEQQFLLSRDGLDPYWFNNSGLKISLPGTHASRPFRPLSYVDTTSSATSSLQSIEHTMLRKMRYEPALSGDTVTDNNQPLPAQRRQLFEAQTRTSFTANNIDYHSKHRLLGKLGNLTTNRSHVFYVWIGVQFHQAEEDSSGVVRIGQKMTDQPEYRGFFVIDRSRLEEAYDENTQTFDFNSFIISRDTIE